jgi:hypothetical protein
MKPLAVGALCVVAGAVAALAVTASGAGKARHEGKWPQYRPNPFVIRVEIPVPRDAEDSAGGIIVADLTGDGRPDYLVTAPGRVMAYANDGRKLWLMQAEVMVGAAAEGHGLPGHHGPGVQAVDVDADSRAEVLFLTRDRTLHVVQGDTGRQKWQAKPPHPEGAERWEHLAVADFRGRGDRDLLLQATNAGGYRMGRYLAAYAIEDLRQGKYQPLWQRGDFLACAHNGARVADLDGDGRDEVLGGTIVSPEGRMLFRVPLRGHIDSIYAADVRPDLPGLEVVALEEGGPQRVFLYNRQRLIWETHHRNQEPQNAALGEFDLASPGLELWCRSRYDEHQKPFVFDAGGRVIADYELSKVAPADWTVKGVEVINAIHWTGQPRQLAAAKERHKSGDVAIFDPMTGRFVERFKERADRLYVADVSGDWREEVIVLAGGELHIYHNPAPNPRPDRARLWTQDHYRRAKMTWNYYSP